MKQEINSNKILQKQKIIWSIGFWAIAFISAVLTLRQILEYAKWGEIYNLIESWMPQSWNHQWDILDANPLLYPALTLVFGAISIILYRNSNQQ